MKQKDGLTLRFQENRSHMKAVAFRMLGNESEADEAVQEAWLRLTEADSDAINNLAGWLTTVVARVCLDLLRSRRSRQELLAEQEAEQLPEPPSSDDPESDLLLADSIGPAL